MKQEEAEMKQEEKNCNNNSQKTRICCCFSAAVNKSMETLDDNEITKLGELQAMWLSQGQPHELQRKATKKMGRHYLQESSKVQFNTFGMQAVVFEFHENQARMRLFQM